LPIAAPRAPAAGGRTTRRRHDTSGGPYPLLDIVWFQAEGTPEHLAPFGGFAALMLAVGLAKELRLRNIWGDAST
jgi:hypothetical protein